MEGKRKFFEKYWNIFLYIFFGVITTAVNYLIYLPLYNCLNLSAAFSNIIAWAAAVLVAFFTNKPFVFQSNDWSCKTVAAEFAKFLSLRVISGLVETGIIFLTVDLLCWNGNVLKLLTSVLVVILNYVASNVFVFHQNKKAPG